MVGNYLSSSTHLSLPIIIHTHREVLINNTSIDYNLIKQQIGCVYSHNNEEFIVYDFSISCECYKLWSKKEQSFFFTDYKPFNLLYQPVPNHSGDEEFNTLP